MSVPGSATAADVPGKFDCVINGFGYVFADSVEPSLPFRSHRAIYDFTPPFIERQNVSAGYGDNTQDFFLTASQNDWSLGEQQRFFRSADKDRIRRYWAGSNIDPASVPGQVSLRAAVGTLTFGGAVRACSEGLGGVFAASATHLYLLDKTGSITDESTHGLGASPSQWGIASDSKNAFLSTTAAGTNGVIKWNGASFTTFSASGADSLTFVDNTLFGYRESSGDLVQWDTSGSLTSLFVWRGADGGALTGSGYKTRLRPYGGKIAILRTVGVRGRGELWEYDTAPSQLAEFPANFVAQDMEVVAGIILVSGYVSRNSDLQPAIFYFVNGNTGLLWQSSVAGYTNPTWPALAAYGDGVAFTDDTTGKLMLYNIAVGGVHAIGSYTVTNATPMMAATKDFLLHTRNATTGYYFPTSSTVTSGVLQSSLFDFDNALTKSFRGIKVDFDAPAGATVDIAYQVDSVDSSWTTLKTGATSGVEYTLSGVTGHSIAKQVTLNKGSSSAGPVLKRTYVRAAPELPQYRSGTYIIDCTGSPDAPRELRDGSYHPLTGFEQVQNLLTAARSTAPFVIVDRLNTFTGFIDLNDSEGWDVYEVHPNVENPEKSGAFLVRIKCREV